MTKKGNLCPLNKSSICTAELKWLNDSKIHRCNCKSSDFHSCFTYRSTLSAEDLHNLLQSEESKSETKPSEIKKFNDALNNKDIKKLQKFVRHKDPTIRKKAVLAIGNMKNNDFFSIIAVATADQNQDVQIAAISVLPNFPLNPNLIPLLSSIIRSDVDTPEIKIAAKEAMKKVGITF